MSQDAKWTPGAVAQSLESIARSYDNIGDIGSAQQARDAAAAALASGDSNAARDIFVEFCAGLGMDPNAAIDDFQDLSDDGVEDGGIGASEGGGEGDEGGGEGGEGGGEGGGGGGEGGGGGGEGGGGGGA